MDNNNYILKQLAERGIHSCYTEPVTLFVEDSVLKINAHNQLYFMFSIDADQSFSIEAENSYFDSSDHLRYNLRDIQLCFTGQITIRTSSTDKQPFRFIRITPKT